LWFFAAYATSRQTPGADRTFFTAGRYLKEQAPCRANHPFSTLSSSKIMHATVSFDRNLPLVGLNAKGQHTFFDVTLDPSSPALYASPIDILLQSLAACSMLDIISILGKMKKEVVKLDAALDAERAETHPKVFTSIHVSFKLCSPDCTKAELEKAAGLSMDKYCSVTAMLKASGCKVTWDSEVVDG
jgi:putative redox protein